MVLINFTPKHHLFALPKRATSGSSGFDLTYCGDEPVTLSDHGQTALLPLGFALELPPGYEAQLRPRSGLALKHGITILNAPGTIDSDYRNECKVIMVKTGANLPPFTFEPGQRICQMMIVPILMNLNFELTMQLSETARGEGGFGHTGL